MAAPHQQHQAGLTQNLPQTDPLIDLDNVREQLNRRIQHEVEDLQRRIIALQNAQSLGSECIIATYSRMIENKRRFLLDLDD
ncbi:hypothetical protein [Hydrocarboniclastica marina]|uniref:Uncharacterized protein n=1 Tax=Hydrocarboniclastica marina TaxID=2259620 RepID=A0A4P7XCK7_9ALTE|nr:hypothetical protein [Hydrocarboniclastica marina]MAL97938.1 hypothetical protein [Alteromonadaceae bacterium]QCF24541.1 hypothetical protein soil367_00415 [Hydrocarboniclastica marina]